MENYRGKFPIFENNKDLVYLDSAATTQKPKEVLDAVYRYNIQSNANPGRGSYSLGMMAESEVERVRAKVKEFLHAVEGEEEGVDALAPLTYLVCQFDVELILFE